MLPDGRHQEGAGSSPLPFFFRPPPLSTARMAKYARSRDSPLLPFSSLSLFPPRRCCRSSYPVGKNVRDGPLFSPLFSSRPLAGISAFAKLLLARSVSRPLLSLFLSVPPFCPFARQHIKRKKVPPPPPPFPCCGLLPSPSLVNTTNSYRTIWPTAQPFTPLSFPTSPFFPPLSRGETPNRSRIEIEDSGAGISPNTLFFLPSKVFRARVSVNRYR